MARGAKVEEVADVETIPVETQAFEEFIASLEDAYNTIGNAINMGRELLGVEPLAEGAEEAVEEGEEEGPGDVDLNALDENGLLSLADEYKIEVPRKLRTVNEIRDFLFDVFQGGPKEIIEGGVEEVAEEEVVEEEAPPPPARVARAAAPRAAAPASTPRARGGAAPPPPARAKAPAPSPAAVRTRLTTAARGRAR